MRETILNGEGKKQWNANELQLLITINHSVQKYQLVHQIWLAQKYG